MPALGSHRTVSNYRYNCLFYFFVGYGTWNSGDKTEAVIPMITLLSPGIGLVESFCHQKFNQGFRDGACLFWGSEPLGLAVPSQKAGPIQPWVAKIQACLCDQRCPCLCVCLSLLALHLVCLSFCLHHCRLRELWLWLWLWPG